MRAVGAVDPTTEAIYPDLDATVNMLHGSFGCLNCCCALNHTVSPPPASPRP